MKRRAAILWLCALFFVGVAACGGTPPIPHTVSETNDNHCRTCHLEGKDEAPKTPHPFGGTCVGCHLPKGDLDVGAWGG